MKNTALKLGIGVGLLATGLIILGKKTGFFENDDALYEEYDTSMER
ncbi:MULTISPECIES: hypothetical protein [Enterococcus]|uniref:Methanol dehydrogenase n=1 Tax=Enterococcus sulfureus ATCC 49903 TaxID=1140003 RepID=S0KY74_9ENTE|nr:hypothetical protein [Enterococcus sulfureus]EOT49567.1 hypothetical protein OMY_00495 [Enterococcus sulfureus ATCC 49903]EOT87434.1 hypothetical protein I573_00490 [Enterococcus sulfureus ATCC 49903]